MLNTNSNADVAIFQALIASINRLATAIEGHPSAGPSTAAGSDHALPEEEHASLLLAQANEATLSKNTGRHPNIVQEELARGTGSSVAGHWYAVTCGREPGIYQHVEESNFHTVGVPASVSKRYDSQVLALAAYKRAWALGAVRRRIVEA